MLQANQATPEKGKTSMFKRLHHCQEGMSLIETIISVVLLGMVLASLLVGLNTGTLAHKGLRMIPLRSTRLALNWRTLCLETTPSQQTMLLSYSPKATASPLLTQWSMLPSWSKSRLGYTATRTLLETTARKLNRSFVASPPKLLLAQP